MRMKNETGIPKKQAAIAAGLAIAAAGAGVLATLLLAPKSGKETRKDIKSRAEDAKRMGLEKIGFEEKSAEDRAKERMERVLNEKPRRGFWGWK